EATLRGLNPQARLMRTTYCDVALPLILDVGLFDPQPPADVHSEHDHVHGHLEADGYVAVRFESDRPLSARRFQDFLDKRPAGLVRGKGFLWLAETDRRYVFHLIGDRFTLEDDTANRPVRNRLVLIGRHLDAAHLKQALAHCLAEE